MISSKSQEKQKQASVPPLVEWPRRGQLARMDAK